MTAIQDRPGGDDSAPAVKVAQISSPVAGMPTCRCGARWGGEKTAHCDTCHETFTVVRAFDQHRTGRYTDTGRQCTNPAKVGLVDAGRAYRCWGFAGDRVGEVGHV